MYSHLLLVHYLFLLLLHVAIVSNPLVEIFSSAVWTHHRRYLFYTFVNISLRKQSLFSDKLVGGAVGYY